MSALIHNGDCAFSLPLRLRRPRRRLPPQPTAATSGEARVGRRRRARVTRHRSRFDGVDAPRGDRPSSSHRLKKPIVQQPAARVSIVQTLNPSYNYLMTIYT